MHGERYQPEMPEADALYIIDYLFDVGPVMSGSMGTGPVTHGELRAYQENTGVELQPWEATFIRRLSAEYIGQSQKAEKADCPAPWNVERLQERLKAVRARDSIRALAQS